MKPELRELLERPGETVFDDPVTWELATVAALAERGGPMSLARASVAFQAYLRRGPARGAT